jgi:hypothetical protein
VLVGILPHALAFGQLRDRRLKAPLDILACGYLKLLTVIVSDPHTVLVDPTVLDFANAFCCHASIQRRGRAVGVVDRPWWGPRPPHEVLPVVLQTCDDNHVIEAKGADVRPDFHWDEPPAAAMGVGALVRSDGGGRDGVAPRCLK